MKYWFYSMAFLVSGCTTNPETGTKRLLGLLKVSSGDKVQPSDKAVLIEQFAPFQYVALALIVGGAAFWFFTKGATGAGRFFFGLGLGLSLFAAVVPTVAGYIGIISVVSLVVGLIYMAYRIISSKKSGSKKV